MKKIVFGETEIKALDCYSFRYENGVVVLRIKASESDTEEATLKKLKGNTNPVQYYEDDELKITYEGYSGDYISSYRDGVYEAEVSRVSETEMKVAKNSVNVDELTETVKLILNDLIPSIISGDDKGNVEDEANKGDVTGESIVDGNNVIVGKEEKNG